MVSAMSFADLFQDHSEDLLENLLENPLERCWESGDYENLSGVILMMVN
jgi:hypothetical protein